jgi:signal transduction histidine kinase
MVEAIRARNIDSAVILLTAHADLERVLDAGTRLNIASFLIKPIHSLEQLHFDIQSAIAKRDLERENRALLESLRDANMLLEERIAERTKELARTNEELRRTSNFRADVLKILGHELRTPLAILEGYLRLALDGGGESGVLGPMGHSIARLRNIAEKALLQVKASGDARIPIVAEPTRPEALCREVAERMRPLVAHRRITLEVAGDAGPEPCQWDGGRIEYIVEELLVNAIRATEDGQTVTVRVAGTGEGATIQVIDPGNGIAESDRQRIFEPFVTLRPPRHHTSGQFSFGAQGIGIGLATARLLAGLHGGTLTVSDNPAGRGSVFTLRLPRIVQSTRDLSYEAARGAAQDGAGQAAGAGR